MSKIKEKPDHRITVGELRRHLELFPDDYELYFGDGDLAFYRTKLRGDDLVQIEFNSHTWPPFRNINDE